jgi:ParB family chromosome partitioning protein
MDMFDEAAAMASALKLSGLTQSSLAKNMGVSQSYVANKLRLLSFSEGMKAIIRDSGISERHARAVLRLNNEDEQRDIVKKVKDRHLTVRECEALVDSIADVKISPTVGVKDKRERINAFFLSIKRSLDNLSALGISASITQSHQGNKTYVTLKIEEDF